jgi:hypothetical protein
MGGRTKNKQPRRGDHAADIEAATERTPLIQQEQGKGQDQDHGHGHGVTVSHGCRPLALNVAAMLTVSVALVLLYLVSPQSPLLRQSTWPQPADNLTWTLSPAAVPASYKGPRVHFPANHTINPRLPNLSFPDPSIVRGEDGAWYAFGTNGNGRRIQVARTSSSDPLGEWTLMEHDALPHKAWTSGSNFWAPDVRRVGDGSYVMYYSGQRPQGKHCVGVARSRTVAGPYMPDPAPWECPLDMGGAIDPAGFEDEVTGRRYVVYKVDGNALGHGGSCNNMAEPQQATPIMLQEVDALDGTTKIGAAVAILDRTDEDGPLVEAPNLVRSARDGRYLLFFSTHCFSNPAYDIKFAWADTIEGPYHRGHGARLSGGGGGGGNSTGDGEDEYESQGSLIRTPDFGLRGPGGMTSTVGRTAEGEDEVLLLHGRCGWRRCMYALPYRVL